jgi:GNAT superfamily N-acetyltransferase
MINEIFFKKNTDNSEIKVFHSSTLIHSPATAYLLKNFSDLMISGYVPSYGIPFSNENSILWAEIDNKIAGGLCYYFEKHISRCWIQFSFTEPEFRKQGIYKTLHYNLEDICLKNNIKAIANYVHVDNHIRLKSCESVGMNPHFVRMIKNL